MTRQQREAVARVTQREAEEASKRDEWELVAVDDNDTKERHHFSVKVAVGKHLSFSTEVDMAALVKEFAFLSDKPRRPVVACDFAYSEHVEASLKHALLY